MNVQSHRFFNCNMISARENCQVARVCFTCKCRRCKRCGFDPWGGKIRCSRKWQPAPLFLPGKFHGQRSLAGYSPWGYKELDMIECACTHTHTHTQVCSKDRPISRGSERLPSEIAFPFSCSFLKLRYNSHTIKFTLLKHPIQWFLVYS